MSKLIYSVEDNEEIREIIVCALESVGYEIKGFGNSELLMNAMRNRVPDLILLDIMLPGIDGIETLKLLQSDYAYVPVIMLTAKDAEYDKVTLLDIGACDYITKPFGVLELIARVKANIKRSNVKTENYGEYVADVDRFTITKNGVILTLTNKEFKTLLMLIKARGAIVDKDILLEEVWGDDYEGEARTLNMVILRLRAKLGNNAIETIRGKGFRLLSIEQKQYSVTE